MKKSRGIFGIAISFILDNLLAVILSLVVMSVFGIILDTSFNVIVYAIYILLFVFLMYHQAWHYGSQDLDEENGNRTVILLSGALLAAVPNWIMTLLSLLGVEAVKTAFCIWNLPIILNSDFLNAYPILYAVPCIAIPTIALVGYILGYKRLKLIDYLYYARDKKE